MDDFASETDSDYTSYWRDWVSEYYFFMYRSIFVLVVVLSVAVPAVWEEFGLSCRGLAALQAAGIICCLFNLVLQTQALKRLAKYVYCCPLFHQNRTR